MEVSGLLTADIACRAQEPLPLFVKLAQLAGQLHDGPPASADSEFILLAFSCAAANLLSVSLLSLGMLSVRSLDHAVCGTCFLYHGMWTAPSVDHCLCCDWRQCSESGVVSG